MVKRNLGLTSATFPSSSFFFFFFYINPVVPFSYLLVKEKDLIIRRIDNNNNSDRMEANRFMLRVEAKSRFRCNEFGIWLKDQTRYTDPTCRRNIRALIHYQKVHLEISKQLCNIHLNHPKIKPK